MNRHKKCPETAIRRNTFNDIHNALFHVLRCYVYVHMEKPVSSAVASLACSSLGGYLASLASAREWMEVCGVLRAMPLTRDIHVGLKAADSNLPVL